MRFCGCAVHCQIIFLWHSSRMKLFLAIVLLLSALLPSVRAQQEADDRYVAIYTLIQQADTLADNGQPADALAIYQDAQARLQKFQHLFPNWDTDIVNYRLSDLSDKITKLQAQLPTKPVETSAGTPVDNAVKVDPQVTLLQGQLQAAQDENASLQAKLKEALATQPTMIDAGALANAQEQIRSLMKENDLLKVTPPPVKNSDDAEVSQLRQQLAESVKKLTDEHARAENLVVENTALQRNLARAGNLDATSLEMLRDENGRLKSQLAALQTAANNAGAANELATKLADARARVAALQSANALALLEKKALESKVKNLSSELADTAANSQARIRDLTEERNDLVEKLDTAKTKNSTVKVTDAAAQIAALNNEVNTLRSRIDVDESKPVPFSDEELALFRQDTNPEPIRKSIEQMPAGTAELVASAEEHFSHNEFDQAEADYQKILQRDQNNGLALANIAAIEMQENKLDAAEKHIKAALVQSPEDAYNLATLGFLKFRQQKYDDALDALSHAAKLDPQNPEIQNYLGVTLSHKGLRAQAETALRKALQLDPNYAPAHNNIAVIYLSQNPPLPQLARWHYQKALAAGQPRNAELEKLLADKGAPVSLPQ
jgi:Tfp pilus assembly protein PilF